MHRQLERPVGIAGRSPSPSHPAPEPVPLMSEASRTSVCIPRCVLRADRPARPAWLVTARHAHRKPWLAACAMAIAVVPLHLLRTIRSHLCQPCSKLTPRSWSVGRPVEQPRSAPHASPRLACTIAYAEQRPASRRRARTVSPCQLSATAGISVDKCRCCRHAVTRFRPAAER